MNVVYHGNRLCWLAVGLLLCSGFSINGMMAPASVKHLLTYIHDTGMSVVRHLHSTNILVNILDIRRRKAFSTVNVKMKLPDTMDKR